MRLDLTPAQADFERSVRAWAAAEAAPRAAAIDAANRFPSDLVARAAAHGLTGLTTPAAHGGAGRDGVSAALAIAAAAEASATLGAILAVHQVVAETVHRAGTPAQREAWLGRLASGAAIGAFALSEAHAGTDAARLETTASAQDGRLVLRGRKVWVANGAAAAAVIVVAAAAGRDGPEGAAADVFLVPLDRPGLHREPVADPLGLRGLGCVDLHLDGVVVDAGDRLGDPGQGWRVAGPALAGLRTAVGALALGLGAAAFGIARRHARTRQAFGQPIGARQAIQWPIADTATELAAARWLVWRAAAAGDGADRAPQAAMAKLAAVEAALRAADRALRILASAGCRRGAPAERIARDARAAAVLAGTAEAQRLVVAAHLTGDDADA